MRSWKGFKQEVSKFMWWPHDQNIQHGMASTSSVKIRLSVVFDDVTFRRTSIRQKLSTKCHNRQSVIHQSVVHRSNSLAQSRNENWAISRVSGYDTVPGHTSRLVDLCSCRKEFKFCHEFLNPSQRRPCILNSNHLVCTTAFLSIRIVDESKKW